jgi:hypothetical protein
MPPPRIISERLLDFSTRFDYTLRSLPLGKGDSPLGNSCRAFTQRKENHQQWQPVP